MAEACSAAEEGQEEVTPRGALGLGVGELVAVPRLRGTQHTVTCSEAQADDVRIAILCFTETQGWSVEDHYRLPAPGGGQLVVWHLRRHPCGIPYVRSSAHGQQRLGPSQ